MSLENVREFEDKLRDDEALRARLQELMDAYDGDRADSRAIFDAVVSPLAAEVGLPYTYDEALEYVAQESDDEDLTAEEAKAVAAGGSNDFCLVIGFGDVAADSCVGGSSLGANACAGVGVGFAVA